MAETRHSDTLIKRRKKRKVWLPVSSVIKVADNEQTAEMRRRAARLYCRAMIRLYLSDNGDPDLGNGVGIL